MPVSAKGARSGGEEQWMRANSCFTASIEVQAGKKGAL